MASQRVGYRAYLLRLWPVRSAGDADEGTGIRAVLQDVQTRERHGFAGLEELFEFLRAQTEETSDSTAENDLTLPSPEGRG